MALETVNARVGETRELAFQVLDGGEAADVVRCDFELTDERSTEVVIDAVATVDGALVGATLTVANGGTAVAGLYRATFAVELASGETRKHSVLVRVET